jgi:hypothetical protein
MIWPLLAGTSLAARIRRLTFAIFGLATVAGLALVAFVAQTGYPVLSVAPLPLPGPALTAPGVGVTLGEAAGPYGGVTVDLSGIPGLASDAGSAVAPLALDGGLLTDVGSGGSTQPGLASAPGEQAVGDERHTGVTAVTPAQQPTTPPSAALAAAPVTGSSPSSALFVRSSVAPGLGEEGDLAESAPVVPEEPEVPVEPEIPVEPEVPVEPPVEPEVPVEPPVEPEPPAEAPAEEAPATEVTPEVPVG